MIRLVLLLALTATGCSGAADLPESPPETRGTPTSNEGETHAPVPPGDDA